MLNANDQKVTLLLEAWHKNQELDFRQCHYTNITPDQKHVHEGSKYLRLDNGGSGHFMVNRQTEQVYSIKGYGVPNLKKPRGTVEFLTAFIQTETLAGREYTHKYWYTLHQTD